VMDLGIRFIAHADYVAGWGCMRDPGRAWVGARSASLCERL
jgi:hypothetical protein